LTSHFLGLYWNNCYIQTADWERR